ncbi:MAG: ATP-binding cassette domain-containing protein [Geminicoccaceae bacterium]|nr:ATP-binding cassette domain-containing protein [Geminicoccaceae bacterium]
MIGRLTAARAEPGPLLPLEVEGLVVEAGGRRLLDGLSFTLRPQRCTVILGPNGAGKSLLLRVLHGLVPPDRGVLRWAEPDPDRRRLGQAFVFQKPVLLRRSVCGDLAVALAARDVPRRERRARIAEAVALAGLEGFERRAARSLSGGEQQRLALARAWALRPQLLFLDEPTASLDPAATRMVEAIVRDLAARGVTIVMSTHDLGQARRLAEEVLFLYGGRLVEAGDAGTFFAHPASVAARAFLEGELLA